MKLWLYLLAAIALVMVLFVMFNVVQSHVGSERASVLSTTAWQRMASPGALSRSHTFLEHNCAACHTATKGPEATKCIVCHANSESLLQRQPTCGTTSKG